MINRSLSDFVQFRDYTPTLNIRCLINYSKRVYFNIV